MNDTHPEIQKRLDAQMRALSPETRLEMAFSMRRFAVELIEMRIREEQPSIQPSALREWVFRRMYPEIPDAQVERIMSHLERVGR